MAHIAFLDCLCRMWSIPGGNPPVWKTGEIMDPNETLRQLRETSQLIQNYYEAGIDIRDEDAYDLACYCKALDQWMRKGGFLPDAWRKHI